MIRDTTESDARPEPFRAVSPIELEMVRGSRMITGLGVDVAHLKNV
jgi:hypothetical protein